MQCIYMQLCCHDNHLPSTVTLKKIKVQNLGNVNQIFLDHHQQKINEKQLQQTTEVLAACLLVGKSK